jgi:3-isopropylmalate/(R)-2-methylmalate dehydratase small subunit
MSLERIVHIVGRAVPVPGDDIDTDLIVPARFLKCVSFERLGGQLFHDLRFRQDGTPAGFPLDDPRFRGASVLVAGRNFGCGSSREHAPQALRRAGFRAIVAESFAEIFCGNATALGIPCVSVPPAGGQALAAAVDADPSLEVVVDLESQAVTAGAVRLAFSMKPGTREALVAGHWDPLGLLLEGQAETDRVAAALPYLRF